MPWSGRFSCALLAAFFCLGTVWAQDSTPTPTPTPEPTPIPNEVDLAKFKGRYRGACSVTLDSGALYVGRSRTRISVPELTATKISIRAAVTTPDRRVPLGNALTFTSDGIVRGRNLAPGVLARARFEGLYTATPRRITFSGTYEAGKQTGRFTGSLTAGKLGSFTLRYSIFPGESVTAAYTYQYTGKANVPR